MSDIPFAQLTFDELSFLVKRAASGGQLDLLREILQTHNSSEELRGLAVACAAEAGHLEIIQELLKNGATISQEYRGQAVINAALEGHHHVIHELLKSKAVIAPDDWKDALRCAVEHEHLKCVHELSENVPLESHSKVPKRKPK